MASPAASPDSSSHEALSSVNSAPACSPASDSENLSPDELELLAKLEEQNLLEADSKSMRSMNGSRRNSGSSLVSSSSASSNLSHLEEDTWILWGRIVNEWDEWRKKKEKLLKELIRKGIPHHFRAIVWQLLCSATDMPVKNQYSELLKMSSPCEKLIRRDIARTYPEHEFFKGQDSLGQEVLFNVMKFFQKVIPHQFDSCPDKLILKAYQVKYNPKKMKRLEKEYAAIKNKEMEEQIEIKVSGFSSVAVASGAASRLIPILPPQRLRTENRLLKQRIETLEKESAALADRLIQGQVTRAQEAEENYIIKRELAVVKQQCSSATENLQRAQSTIRELQDQQGNPRFTEEFVTHLETELEQSRLREAETLGALKEMQDKVLDMEKRNSLLPDEHNVARLQEELKALKVREAEAVKSLKELQQQVKDLNDTWQAQLARASGRWKDSPRKNNVNELQDELLATRLREAQAQAELRELRQRVVELETQDQIHSNLLNRTAQECAGLQEKLHYVTAQNKGLQTQLSESKRKHAESECK
ncbi:EVI5L protein, partial [Nothoprocta ornata]|nr:EVI5L protein [Nothoprocta ornata]